ncbi:MAG: pyridoxal phosphate-dependent aminotransferase [Ignavibacteria bacterium]|nr:pyridoxal phosphate-dependent aminotransferase [Ignavibacteria bacterium]
MGIDLSRRALAAAESATLKIASRAKSMVKNGIDVVSLSTGEPDFDTPQCAKLAAFEAITTNFTHYTDSNGIYELRAAVAEKFKNENGLTDATPETVIITTGAKQALMNTLGAICNPGDEVIVFAPYWVSYPAMVTLSGATPIILSAGIDQHFKITPQQLTDALTPLTKCVILNSPNNPTGSMYSPTELNALAEVLATHSCYVISDEIYEKINYNTVTHCSIGSFESLKGRVITVNGVSKAYAMTGWRIGFLHAPANLLCEAAKVQGQTTSNPNSIAQIASLAALLHGADEPLKI